MTETIPDLTMNEPPVELRDDGHDLWLADYLERTKEIA